MLPPVEGFTNCHFEASFSGLLPYGGGGILRECAGQPPIGCHESLSFSFWGGGGLVLPEEGMRENQPLFRLFGSLPKMVVQSHLQCLSTLLEEFTDDYSFYFVAL